MKSFFSVVLSLLFLSACSSLAGRVVHIMSRVYTPAGSPLFSFFAHDENAFGVIGAAVGDSRDEMVTSVTRQTVDETVKELRKPQGNLHQ